MVDRIKKGKRNFKTAKELRKKLSDFDVSFDTVYTDNWESFNKVFSAINHIIGKKIQLTLKKITADYVIPNGT